MAEEKPSKTYTGSCHCGANAFSIPVSPPLDDPEGKVMSCNCSICAKNAYLLSLVPASSVTWTKGSLDNLTSYQFAHKKYTHYFCPTCGSTFLASGGNMMGFNVRFIDDVDVEKLHVTTYDGKSM